MSYSVVIGLEVHAQLATNSKLFCSCKANFGDASNTNVCPVCLGMPGVLPVPNKQAVESAVMMGLALDCDINPRAMWTRKNYFYPDLPKGYQVTQQGGNEIYDQPICKNGHLDISVDGHQKTIGITRIHMEEDAGKLIHDLTDGDSLFDANRCGTPLLEIVSEPDLRSPAEAKAYLEKIKHILEYLEISDANMEKGNLRCDANVSLRADENAPLGDRVEIKNMNSFTFLEQALYSEIELQTMLLDKGEKIKLETKRWDPAKNSTISMRTKEEADDYRYFPEPDLIRLSMVDESYIQAVKEKLPELPGARKLRFQNEYELSDYDSDVLTSDKKIANYYEDVCKVATNKKSAANWVMEKILREIKNESNETTQDHIMPVKAENLGKLVNLIEDKTISGRIAKEVFDEMVNSDASPTTIVEKKGLKVITDEGALQTIIEDLIKNNPAQVEDYRSGKTKILGFFMGQVMKSTGGKASPDIVSKLLKKSLAG